MYIGTPDRKSTTLDRITVLDSYDYWIVAGTGNESIAIWDMISGALVQSFSAHFLKVNVIDGFIISAGEDATVHLFSITNVMKGNL